MATAGSRQSARREPMSRVDTAWLSMERPTNPMMITGVLMFAEPMSLDGPKRVIKQRFLVYTRFSQRAVETAPARPGRPTRTRAGSGARGIAAPCRNLNAGRGSSPIADIGVISLDPLFKPTGFEPCRTRPSSHSLLPC